MSEDEGRLDLEDLSAARNARAGPPDADSAALRAQEPCAPLADQPPTFARQRRPRRGLRHPGAAVGGTGRGDHAGQPAVAGRGGAVVELDRKVGESIDILVNNRLVARGEVVILDDRLGVTMTVIIKSKPYGAAERSGVMLR